MAPSTTPVEGLGVPVVEPAVGAALTGLTPTLTRTLVEPS